MFSVRSRVYRNGHWNVTPFEVRSVLSQSRMTENDIVRCVEQWENDQIVLSQKEHDIANCADCSAPE